MLKINVIEPLRVSVQEIQASTEAATMILRIDDIIASKGGGGGGMPPGGAWWRNARWNASAAEWTTTSPTPFFLFLFFW